MKKLSAIVLLVGIFLASTLNAGYNQERRVLTSTKILQNILKAPKTAITEKLLHNAKAIAIFPNVAKGAFLLGVSSGKGILSIKDAKGKWSNPIFVKLGNLSLGLQIGLKTTDLIMVFKNYRSLDDLADGKVTISANAGAVAISKGIQNSVETDEKLTSRITSAGKSNGIYAGASISGGSLTVSNNDDFDYYDDLIYVNDILAHDKVKDKPESIKFMQVLNSL